MMIRQLNNILQRSMIVVTSSQLQTRIEQVLNQRQARSDGDGESDHRPLSALLSLSVASEL